MKQLAFHWSHDPGYAPEDFLPSASNREALARLERWPETVEASPVLLLTGPAASGKTHLARRWAARNGAARIAPETLGHLASEQLWGDRKAAWLDDIDRLDASQETALFHLLRHAEAQKTTLLLLSRLPAHGLAFRLPDLTSRLRALEDARLLPPDEAFLRNFLLKCLADRQLHVEGEAIAYLLNHAERSPAYLRALVVRAERQLFETKKPLTVPALKRLLAPV